MNLFPLDLKKLALAILIILPLVFLNMQHKTKEQSWFYKPMSAISGLLQSAYVHFSDTVRGTTSHYLNLLEIKTSNRLLLSENSELKAQLAIFNEMTIENRRLAGLLEFKAQTKMDLLAAKVIGTDPLIDHSTIFINLGTRHGLKAGMAVISTEGAVGYIFRPELTTSQVLLLTNRYAVIDALAQRSRARGIVEGKSRKACQMRYLERGDDVRVGDLIVTSGLDNIFPKGFPVAIVDKIRKDPLGTSQKVDLIPIAKTSQLEEVFVVKNANFVNSLPEITPKEGTQ